ncbi:MAG: RelA/SpoT family protein [Coxiellaceae bacterium]|nr:RelA/SpoT family protein [Coxiellaceae bacterium]
MQIKHYKLIEWLEKYPAVSTVQEAAYELIAAHESLIPQSIYMANILEHWQCDDDLITASILYPLLSKDITQLEKAEKQFDKSIIKPIKSAIHMDMIHDIKRDQAEALRKMMLAMVDDIRVVLLKLAERLYLVTHLENKADDFQKKIAQETMDYYAPLANRLGMNALKFKLEDGAFRYLNPDDFKEIQSAFQSRKEDRKRIIKQMIFSLKEILHKNNIIDCEFSGRVKHLYSIYKKIKRKEIGLENLYDTTAIRIIVPNISDCYTVLSLAHEQWKPIPEEFDDYIVKPKPNGYQSIHTAVLLKNNTPIEIQIRTKEMHKNSEQGIAAHWKYKENKAIQDKESDKIILLRELLDWQNVLSQTKDTAQLYRDAFHDRVYVFSPNGEVFDLQQGATPLDFAYLVHTDIGNRCRGAKINGALVPLTHTLKTGDHIDILTSKEPHPSHDWIRPELGYLKTMHAIRKVKAWYRKLDFEKHLADGLALWEKIARQYDYQRADLEKVLEGFHLQNTDTLLAALGAGDITLPGILQKLNINTKTSEEVILTHERSTTNKTSKVTAFSVQGAKNLLTQLAQCCHPIPGDEIIGYITKNRGITVHQKNCRNGHANILNNPERLIKITWEGAKERSYLVNLVITAEDRPGLLRDITVLISQLNLSLSAVRSHRNQKNNIAYIALTIDVNSLSLLEDITKKMRQISGIVSVLRK